MHSEAGKPTTMTALLANPQSKPHYLVISFPPSHGTETLKHDSKGTSVAEMAAYVNFYYST